MATGMTISEVEKHIRQQELLSKEEQFDVDAETASIKEPITKQGDLWQLGSHRLLCGDSTKKEDVDRLMNKEIPIVCITDPPYSVNYENLKRLKDTIPTRTERGDVYKDPPAEKVLEFIRYIYTDMLVMTYPINKHFHLLSEMTEEFDLLYDCVWIKNRFTFILGRNYKPQHEPVLIFRKKKGKGKFNVPANQSTLFSFNNQSKKVEHPTIKPLGLYELLVQFHSDEGDTVYEPFCGSGTTLIACEKNLRNCLAIEIEPIYCDVIIKRWEAFTGQKAVKIGD